MKAKASRGRKAAVEEKEGRKGCKRPPREKHRRVADGRGEEGKGEPETVVRANRETVAGGEAKVRPMAKGEEPVPRCAPEMYRGAGRLIQAYVAAGAQPHVAREVGVRHLLLDSEDQVRRLPEDQCQGRRETRPKGGAKHCHRGRGVRWSEGVGIRAWGGGAGNAGRA